MSCELGGVCREGVGRKASSLKIGVNVSLQRDGVECLGRTRRRAILLELSGEEVFIGVERNVGGNERRRGGDW